MRAMKNYAGHRLSPWLGHLMVSRSETARPLLTPGEVMQLSPADEIVMVSGTPPIRAKKVRYFEDRRFLERVLPPPEPAHGSSTKHDDWSVLPPPTNPVVSPVPIYGNSEDTEDPTGSEKRRQPELIRPEVAENTQTPTKEFLDEFADEADDDAMRARRMTQIVQGVARQVSLDPNDGMDL
jgi:type IV secretion system protein VirD4